MLGVDAVASWGGCSPLSQFRVSSGDLQVVSKNN